MSGNFIHGTSTWCWQICPKNTRVTLALLGHLEVGQHPRACAAAKTAMLTELNLSLAADRGTP